MDLGLLQQILLNIAQEPAKIPISKTFESLKKDRFTTMALGSEHIYKALQHECSNVNAAILNGVMFGVVLSYCIENAEVKEYLQNWVKEFSKAKGDNVIDFLGRKAEQNGNGK